MAGRRVRVQLLAPEREFVYRPLAVAEPFGLAHPARIGRAIPIQRATDVIVGTQDGDRRLHGTRARRIAVHTQVGHGRNGIA